MDSFDICIVVTYRYKVLQNTTHTMLNDLRVKVRKVLLSTFFSDGQGAIRRASCPLTGLVIIIVNSFYSKQIVQDVKLTLCLVKVSNSAML